MKPLGTILPTRESLEAGDRHAEKMEMERCKIAVDNLGHCERRVVFGETRYYRNPKQYAVVGRGMKIRWFETRKDGDWPINENN